MIGKQSRTTQFQSATESFIKTKGPNSNVMLSSTLEEMENYIKLKKDTYNKDDFIILISGWVQRFILLNYKPKMNSCLYSKVHPIREKFYRGVKFISRHFVSVSNNYIYVQCFLVVGSQSLDKNKLTEETGIIRIFGRGEHNKLKKKNVTCFKRAAS